MVPDTLAAYLRLSNADRDLSEKEENNSVFNPEFPESQEVIDKV